MASLFSSSFVQGNGPGGAVDGAERDLEGLDRGAGEGHRRGRKPPVMYTS